MPQGPPSHETSSAAQENLSISHLHQRLQLPPPLVLRPSDVHVVQLGQPQLVAEACALDRLDHLLGVVFGPRPLGELRVHRVLLDVDRQHLERELQDERDGA